VQFLITCNIPFSLFIMVAIAVDRYLCICHPFTRLLTVFRAKLTVVVLALCAGAIGVCVALTYGVYNQFPLYALMAAASANQTLQPAAAAHDVTPVSAGNDVRDWDGGNELATCGVRNCSNHQASDVELYLLNFGVCHANGLLLSSEFQRHFQYFYYALFTLCLLIMSVLYALIYYSVLARRSRRHKQKTASLAAMNSTLRPAATVCDNNCEQMMMSALKVRTDIEARKTDF